MTLARSTLLVATIAWILPLLAGCDSQSGSGGAGGGGSTLPTVPMQLGSKSFTLEVADNDATRQYGLMRRDSMPSDHGMIFVFNREAPLTFWMKDTRIPLDIIFVNSNGTVVSVKQMKPYDQDHTPSDGDVQYAIELNKGSAESAGVKVGMTLKLPPGLKAKD
ncbi:MAG TPA: DUF192 domain-containing protein [Tepidisphaeraceae bacterium]|jgi:hypothetical protein